MKKPLFSSNIKKRNKKFTFSFYMNNFHPLAKLILTISLLICLASSIYLAILYDTSGGLLRANIHISLGESVSAIMISVIIALCGAFILDYSQKHDKK